MPNFKDKRILALIIILLLLLAIGVAVYFVLPYFKAPANKNANTVANKNINQTPAQIQFPDLSDQTQNDIKFMARFFAERYGSYSNQSGYQNLDDLKPYMTPSMQNWISQYKKDLGKQHPDLSQYYGLETKVLSLQFTKYEDKAATAEIMVKTQRKEFIGSMANPRIFNQDILLKFVKNGDAWLVDGAYWQ